MIIDQMFLCSLCGARYRDETQCQLHEEQHIGWANLVWAAGDTYREGDLPPYTILVETTDGALLEYRFLREQMFNDGRDRTDKERAEDGLHPLRWFLRKEKKAES